MDEKKRIPKNIFISYRKDDAAEVALSLFNHLKEMFGEKRVFRDIESLPAGRWRDKIAGALSSCKAVLVVIGKNWLTIADKTGKRRLDRADDVHRQEIATALQNSDVTVIPVYTEGARIPEQHELPKDIRSLTERQFFRLYDSSLHRNIALNCIDKEISKALGTPLKKPFLISPAGERLSLATDRYLAGRGPKAYRDFTSRPREPWDSSAGGALTVRDLRMKLIQNRVKLRKPAPTKVRGTLLPCALLSSGWWERHGPAQTREVRWRDPIQKWLFFGFELWGPSWDFSWNFEQWERSKQRPYFIAQLGDGDEANSLPVLIPQSKAFSIQKEYGDDLRHGLEAEIVGVLGHRKHFAAHIDPKALELFGGLLDYCLWIDGDNPRHKIQALCEATSVYSGYLWKCIAPKIHLVDHKLTLSDVYFVWEHTNFASQDAIKYNLDSLQRKEDFIKQLYGGREFVLVQKSSSIVPGEPQWSSEEIYNLLLGRKPLVF